MPSRNSARILNFQPDLRGAKVGIEDRADIADPALQNQVRVSIQMNVRVFTEADKRKIVFIHVAQHPDVREIGNREWVRTREALHARRVGHLLVGDHAGGGRVDIDDGGGMIDVGAQYPEVIDAWFRR